MRAEAAVACALVAALVALPLAVGALPGPAGQDAPSAPDDRVTVPASSDQQALATPTSVPPGRTVTMDVSLHRSGDARWTVSMYVPLEDDNETRAFEQLGDDFVEGRADVRFDVDLFEQYLAAASEGSDRSMAIPGASVDRSASVVDGTGVLTLEFTWTNFARTEGNRLVVNDSFRTESGTWLPRLEDGQVLVIRPPPGFSVIRAPTGHEDATFRWEGPRAFEDDYFDIVYTTDANVRSPTDTTAPPTTTSPGGPVDDARLLLVFAAILFGGGLAAYLLTRHGPVGEGIPVSVSTSGPADEPAAGAADGPRGNGEDVPAATADDDGEPAATPSDPFAAVDVELLSDEERVLRLLEANGGRMKQARIVTETDWSNAKVSQLLSSMDEDDDVDKLRIGRENIISLPDVDVEDVET